MKVSREHSALLLVDIQPDFVPGGNLPVEEGHQILDGVRRLMISGQFPLQVATQDWHPPGHISFASSHPGAEPLQAIRLYGHDQILWPDHCVQGSRGAELHPDLPWETASMIVRKGTDPRCDSYSAFRNNWNDAGERPATGLKGFLRERDVSTLYVCGLARDVCVKWTVEDALADGFAVRVFWELTRPVDRGTDPYVTAELTRLGAQIV